MKNYVKSSPHFFRLVKGACFALLVVISLLAILIPAPLQEPASLARVPNPVKSAWFLLWIQELVSYTKYLIYAVAATGLFFLILPWLPDRTRRETTHWFPGEQWGVTAVTLVVFAAIIVLTVIALFFRGANWSLVVCS
jgi:hypothetical protein